MNSLKEKIAQNISAKVGGSYQIILTELDPYMINEIVINTLSICDLIPSFINAKRIDGLAQGTLCRYAEELKLFSRHMSKNISDITITDLRSYISDMQSERPLKKTTVNNKITILRNFFKYLFDEEIIPKDPAKKLKTKKIDLKSLRSALTIEELETLRDVCIGVRERVLIEFFVSTGCRIEEVINITMESINFVDRSIIVTGKGDKTRTVYFSVKCCMLLMNYIGSVKKGSDDHIFTGERYPYEALSKSGIERIVTKIANRTPMSKNVSPHILRHTFATTALAKGMSLDLIQQLLGHENINTTQIYAKYSSNTIKFAYEQYIGN